MTTAIRFQLSYSIIKGFRELIRANIDTCEGLHSSADEIKEKSLARLLRQIANELTSLASELQEYVRWIGDNASEKRTLPSVVQHALIKIRSKLNGGDLYLILRQAERSKGHLKHAYQELLRETAGSSLNQVLLRQYLIVKSGHDKIRNLRDGYRLKS